MKRLLFIMLAIGWCFSIATAGSYGPADVDRGAATALPAGERPAGFETVSERLSLPSKSEAPGAGGLVQAASNVRLDIAGNNPDAVDEVKLAGAISWSDTISVRGFCNVHFNGDIEVVNNPYMTWQTGVCVGTTWYGITSGMSMSDGTQWVVDLGAYDLTDDFRNTKFVITDNKGLVATDMTWDPVTQKIYGCFYNDQGTGYVFGTIDFETEQRTVICNLSERWQAIAADPYGTIYVLTIGGILGTIDPETGEFFEIGDTGLRPTFYSSMHIDAETGRMFLSYEARSDQPQQTGIWEIDRETAQATVICRYGGRTTIGGLYTPVEASPEAPAVPTGLEADFEGNSLEGVIRFTAPTTLQSGAPASGSVNYEVKVGMTLYTGTTTYGATVEVPVAVNYNQDYEIWARMKNSAGYGPKARTTRFIGYGEACAPTNVKLQYNRAENRFDLTWDAVTGTVDGSYIDPSMIVYELVRMPDNYRDYTTGTSLSYTLPEGAVGTYYYNLRTSYLGYFSKTVKSNVVHVGTLTPPYVNDFDSETSFYDFASIDANEDGKTWAFYQGSDSGKALLRPPLGPVNDWLVSPPIKLNAGQTYQVSFSTEVALPNYPETFGVFVGKDATPEALTQEVIPYTTINENTAINRTGAFSVAEDGEYFVGIHSLNELCYYLMLDDFKLTALDGGVPEAPGLTVAPKSGDIFYCSVGITAPTKSIDGEDLTDPLTLVQLFKITNTGSELIYWKRNVEPGTELSYGEREENAGDVTFMAVATNASGRGIEATATAYIGVALPNAPSYFNAYERPDVGNTHLEWTAPATDVNNHPIEPSSVTYTLYQLENGQASIFIGAGIPMTELNHTVCFPNDPQRFVQYGILSANAAGTNQLGTPSPIFPVGKAYDMPFFESAPNAELQTIMAVDSIAGTARWMVATDGAVPGAVSVDGDNGLFAFYAENAGDHADLQTGKVLIAGDNPTLTFFYLATGEESENTIEVLGSLSQNIFTSLATITTDGPVGQWKKAAVPLSQYRDGKLRLRLRGTCVSHQYSFIDNIRIIDCMAHNVAASSVDAPSTANPGKPFTVTARFENIGAEDAQNVTMSLYHNGEVIASRVADLASDEVAEITVEQCFNVLDMPTHSYSAKVEYDLDEDSSDNLTPAKTVFLDAPVYPAPTDLVGSVVDGDIQLSWTAPESWAAATGDNFTEDFESTDYEPFACDDFGPWTLVSLNPNYNYVILDGNGGAYDYPHSDEPVGFMLFTPSAVGNNRPEYAPHSGNTMLVSISKMNLPDPTYTHNDEWLISPELNLLPKQLTFWAKTAIAKYMESLEVLVSFTDNNPASFVKLEVPGYTGTVPAEWTQYSVKIPYESKYFAIRCVSADKLCLMIDDIEVTDLTNDLVLEAYNIYRDGSLLMAADATEPTFVDRDNDGNSHVYQVSAFYNYGESLPTNSVVIGFSDIDSLGADGINVYSTRGTIVVDGAAGHSVEIVNAAGVTIYSAIVDGRQQWSVASGVYMVKIDGRVVKLIVK